MLFSLYTFGILQLITRFCTVHTNSQNESSCTWSCGENSGNPSEKGKGPILLCKTPFLLMSRLKDKAALPLRDFMRRFQVLSLYRNMNRAARQVADPNLRLSLCEEISVGFRQNQMMKDVVSVKSTMVEANRQLQQLRAMGASGTGSTAAAAKANAPPGSWLGDSTPDDERGRVGTDWPWQR
jgi:hypothetical protein